MRDAFARTVYEVAKRSPNLFVVAADISPVASMAAFRSEFPDRWYNVGVAEQSMIGICAGLAMRGCRPFAYTIATFALYRPFEQVRDDVCYQNLPVTIVGMGAGVTYGSLGSTHHALEDIAIMTALPNMTVLAPCDARETEASTWACASGGRPAYLRLGKSGEPDLTSQAPEPFQFGRIRCLKEGKDLCFLSYGPILKMACDVAHRLEKEHGRSAAVMSVHTLKPLDTEGIRRVLERFPTVVVVEEHSERGGLGAQVKQLAWDHRARCALQTFGLRDEFVHVYGTQEDVWRAHGLTPAAIYERIVSV